jgi:hypothetical protein
VPDRDNGIWSKIDIQQYIRDILGGLILDVLLAETQKMYLCVKTLHRTGRTITACETCKNVFEMYSKQLTLSLSLWHLCSRLQYLQTPVPHILILIVSTVNYIYCIMGTKSQVPLISIWLLFSTNWFLVDYYPVYSKTLSGTSLVWMVQNNYK